MEENKALIDRIRYNLDAIYSRGTLAAVITLGLLSLFLAVICTVILIVAGLAPGGEEPYPVQEALWVGMLSIIGDISIGGRESPWAYRILMLGMTFGSIFISSFFISALTNGMVGRVSELKRGRSTIVEKNHAVILGWSEQVFPIISELMFANANQPYFCIAILGPLAKEDMEDQINQKITKTGKTKIVCRTGDPMEMADLKIVSLNTARTVIVLQPESKYPDADVIKIVLAILNHPGRRKAPYHIVASLQNPRNQKIARVAGKDEVQWVVTSEVVSRVIAQTSLQPGLSFIYDDLFDFEDNDIYLKEEPQLVGKTFLEAQFSSENNTVIGICQASKQIQLNPPPAYLIQQGDRLIVIAMDDGEIHFQSGHEAFVDERLIKNGQRNPKSSRNILLLGWNWRGSKVIEELNHYAPPGSKLTVLVDHEKVEQSLNPGNMALENLRVHYSIADTDDRQVLEDVLKTPFDHIIILGYSDKLATQRADAKTLVTLLHLRDIKNTKKLPYSIVTEMMDSRNYYLAKVASADDYIVSDRLISLLMAQMAESQEHFRIFEEFLNAESSEIYLKPASDYIDVGEPTNFYTVVEAASRGSEVAMGYRIVDRIGDSSRKVGIFINPLKSELITFAPGDQIIVLAER